MNLLTVPLFHFIKKLNENVVVEETLGYLMDAITLTRHKLEGKVPLIGFSGAPVSCIIAFGISTSIGHEPFLLNIYYYRININTTQ